jgi:hypothetical protein
MGWAVGYSNGRDIGYGVPAICDHPDCDEPIDRGLGYICGWGQFDHDDGCGLYFCPEHGGGTLCERCDYIDSDLPYDVVPFDPKPDTAEWIHHKLTDPSWQQWRDENPAKLAPMVKRLAALRGI